MDPDLNGDIFTQCKIVGFQEIRIYYTKEHRVLFYKNRHEKQLYTNAEVKKSDFFSEEPL